MHLERLGPDGRCTTRRLAPPDLPALQALFERAADYFRLATGHPPAPDEAPRAFVAGPPSKAVDDKRTIGIFTEGTLIGVLDALIDWPDPGSWTIGMLLLDPAWRARGLGTAVLEAFERWAAAEGAQTLRTAVVEHHTQAIHFLERHAYERAGTHRVQAIPGTVLVFTKTL